MTHILRSAATGLLLIAGLGAAPAFATADALPAPLNPFEATYDAGDGNIRVGTTTIRLHEHPRGWRYSSVTEAEGLFALMVDGPIRETVWLEQHEGRLRPLEYRHEEEDEGVRVAFAWSEGEARVRDDGTVRRLALEPSSQDQFSAILTVVQALAAGEDTVTIPGIDDDGEHESLTFERAGEERLSVPFGTFDTIRVRRRHDSKRTTVTWLAPELGWLPVRVEQRKKGKVKARLDLVALDGEEGSAGTRKRGR